MEVRFGKNWKRILPGLVWYIVLPRGVSCHVWGKSGNHVADLVYDYVCNYAHTLANPFVDYL